MTECLKVVPGLLIWMVLISVVVSVMLRGMTDSDYLGYRRYFLVVTSIIALTTSFSCALLTSFAGTFVSVGSFLVWTLFVAPVVSVFYWAPWLIDKIRSIIPTRT